MRYFEGRELNNSLSLLRIKTVNLLQTGSWLLCLHTHRHHHDSFTTSSTLGAYFSWANVRYLWVHCLLQQNNGCHFLNLTKEFKVLQTENNQTQVGHASLVTSREADEFVSLFSSFHRFASSTSRPVSSLTRISWKNLQDPARRIISILIIWKGNWIIPSSQ